MELTGRTIRKPWTVDEKWVDCEMHDKGNLESRVREMLEKGERVGKGKRYAERDALIKTIEGFVNRCP